MLTQGGRHFIISRALMPYFTISLKLTKPFAAEDDSLSTDDISYRLSSPSVGAYYDADALLYGCCCIYKLTCRQVITATRWRCRHHAELFPQSDIFGVIPRSIDRLTARWKSIATSYCFTWCEQWSSSWRIWPQQVGTCVASWEVTWFNSLRFGRRLKPSCFYAYRIIYHDCGSQIHVHSLFSRTYQSRSNCWWRWRIFNRIRRRFQELRAIILIPVIPICSYEFSWRTCRRQSEFSYNGFVFAF